MSCMTSMTSYFPYIIIKNRKKSFHSAADFCPKNLATARRNIALPYLGGGGVQTLPV